MSHAPHDEMARAEGQVSEAKRALWCQPTVRRLEAGRAEILAATKDDGVSTQS